jgi:ABC-2 type transport system ATP-binding protein
MRQTFSARLAEVSDHYHSGDHHLGLRRLIDAALETRSPIIFEKVLTFFELTERDPSQDQLSQVQSLIDSIAAAGIAKPATTVGPVIEVKGVSKIYRKGRFKLSPVDVSIAAGQIVGLVGENGNGKTTLLRILAGELSTDTGDITYSLSQNTTSPYELRTRLAFVPQLIPRWWGTLRDNLNFTAALYGLKGRENELWVEMIIARLGLRPFRDLSWNSISSGYRTRFELARTLLRRPQILLLDEPLANLDIISQQTILQDLRFLAQSETDPMAVILSSQQIYEVEKVSDFIVFLRQGAPIYQDLQPSENAGKDEVQTIFELETTASREELQKAFEAFQLSQITFNGGVYILTFHAAVTTNKIMKIISDQNFEVNYFRNISRSSRRFFANL